jgi:hypothetical protein
MTGTDVRWAGVEVAVSRQADDADAFRGRAAPPRLDDGPELVVGSQGEVLSLPPDSRDNLRRL